MVAMTYPRKPERRQIAELRHGRELWPSFDGAGNVVDIQQATPDHPGDDRGAEYQFKNES
jgi:hypothetical protein